MRTLNVLMILVIVNQFIIKTRVFPFSMELNMPTKKSKGQFDHYKKWTTDEGYTFVAETKEDAIEYLKHMEHANLGKLREVKDSE